MKLTNIAINGYRQLQHVSLRQISPTLNVIYGEKGSGKTRISDFLKSVFFGESGGWLAPNETVPGAVDVAHPSGQYRLTRANNHRLDIQTLSGNRPGHVAGMSNPGDLGFLTGALDAEVYQLVFDVSFNRDHQDEKYFAEVLHRRLNVPIGIEATGDQSASQRLRDTHAQLSVELNSARDHLHHLQQQQQQCSDEMTRIESQVGEQLSRIDADISRVTYAISQLTPSSVSPHAIDAEIRDLQYRIDNAKPTYVQQPVPQQDLLAGLYTQLDEVDTQLRRWLSVRNDVQQQRIRLKDEMLLWNQMTLDSESHPYHKAREILLELEGRVDHAQSHTVQWLESHGPVDSRQAATFVEDVCKGMREDLYRLCNELSQQYKHIRHKSAATELRQLRRCYEEMGENTQRLADRRDTVLTEIRKLDPAGADVIARGETDFCNCAHHEGFLRARQRFTGSTIPDTVSQTIAPDVSAERNRISILEAQRAELHQQANTHSAELARLQADELALRNQRQSILESPQTTHLKSQLGTRESELQQAQRHVQSLEQELQRLPVATVIAPSPVLISAAKLLRRLTEGELTAVWLDAANLPTETANQFAAAANATAIDLQVRDRYGKVFNSSALATSLKHLTRLSLVLAVKQQLANAGVDAPLLLDEPFNQIENHRIGSTLDVISDFSNVGQHQVLLLTQHRFLIDRMTGAQWFDIENRSVASGAGAYRAPAALPPRPSPAVTSVVSPQIPPPSTVSVYRDAIDNPLVTSIGADQIGDRLEYAVSYDDQVRLSDVPIFDSVQLRTLETSGIVSVGDFLAFAVAGIPRQWVEVGLTESVVADLQSEIWLLTCVPALRPSDAHVLVACGISEPQQLETSDAQVLFERIERYLNAHNNGQSNLQRVASARIADWHRGLSRTRHRWQDGRRSRVHAVYQASQAASSSNSDGHYAQSDRFQRTADASAGGPQIHKFSADEDRVRQNQRHSRSQHSETDRQHRRYESNESRQPLDMPNSNGELERQSDYRQYDGARSRTTEHVAREPRSPRMQTPTPERVRRAIPAMAPAETRVDPVAKPAATRTTKPTRTKQNSKSQDKFYLDLDDHIEAAPSIGPKTAERFEKIGVKTIDQFLKQTAESMAAKLNYKRISADVVRSWQHQARLVCRIPNLRGHDAQILVACNMIEPEEIATMQPQALFDFVGPFSDTKEGQKIIRSGKKPDLAEISDWIAWAQKTRSIQAA